MTFWAKTKKENIFPLKCTYHWGSKFSFQIAISSALFHISGDKVQVVLIDYARIRMYPHSAPVFLDAISQLSKYRSCGVWFEVVSKDQKKLVLGQNEISRAKIVKKNLYANNR